MALMMNSGKPGISDRILKISNPLHWLLVVSLMQRIAGEHCILTRLLKNRTQEMTTI